MSNAEDDIGDLLYDAWCLIANAYHGNWDEDPDWKQAAERWRERWHSYLDVYLGLADSDGSTTV